MTMEYRLVSQRYANIPLEWTSMVGPIYVVLNRKMSFDEVCGIAWEVILCPMIGDTCCILGLCFAAASLG